MTTRQRRALATALSMEGDARIDWVDLSFDERAALIVRAAEVLEDPTLPARISADWAERLLPIVEAWGSPERGPRRALEAARAWVGSPDERHRRGASEAHRIASQAEPGCAEHIASAAAGAAAESNLEQAASHAAWVAIHVQDAMGAHARTTAFTDPATDVNARAKAAVRSEAVWQRKQLAALLAAERLTEGGAMRTVAPSPTAPSGGTTVSAIASGIRLPPDETRSIDADRWRNVLGPLVGTSLWPLLRIHGAPHAEAGAFVPFRSLDEVAQAASRSPKGGWCLHRTFVHGPEVFAELGPAKLRLRACLPGRWASSEAVSGVVTWLDEVLSLPGTVIRGQAAVYVEPGPDAPHLPTGLRSGALVEWIDTRAVPLRRGAPSAETREVLARAPLPPSARRTTLLNGVVRVDWGLAAGMSAVRARNAWWASMT